MSKSTYKFHYVDESGNNTSPENARRIALIMYDENQKISKRIDWKRDEASTSEDCCGSVEENPALFSRTDGIENMKIIINRLMNELRRTGIDSETCSSYEIQGLAKILIDANEKLDEMIWRIFNEPYSEHCDGENCNHE